MANSNPEKKTFAFRADSTLEARLNQYFDEEGLSESDGLRQLVRMGLRHETLTERIEDLEQRIEDLESGDT